jgi:predicted metal-dependent hydrolase
LLERAGERLAGLPDGFMGIDVALLRDGIDRCRAAVERELAMRDGHCRLEKENAPPLAAVGDATRWLQTAAAPTVPDAARATWFDRGLDAYERGEYFEAHELWEELWRDEPPTGDKLFLQGLIQVAAAMHKVISHRQPRPAARLLGRALSKLHDVPAQHWGIDVARVVREAERARQLLLTLEDASGFDTELVPHMVRLAGATRGGSA